MIEYVTYHTIRASLDRKALGEIFKLLCGHSQEISCASTVDDLEAGKTDKEFLYPDNAEVDDNHIVVSEMLDRCYAAIAEAFMHDPHADGKLPLLRRDLSDTLGCASGVGDSDLWTSRRGAVDRRGRCWPI